MTLAICMFVTWCVWIAFSLMPKKLSVLDTVFVLFGGTVFELSIFTLLHVNLSWIVVNPDIEKSCANLVIRLLLIPVALLISTNIMLYDWKVLKWIVAAGILLSFVPLQMLQVRLGVITALHVPTIGMLLFFSAYMLFARLLAGLIRAAGRKEERRLS
ncbi:hypothetical protein [Paenibacillus glycinis]|uniref:Uncharacterized protein n=1 Tax=Paenibacillus glycinis TaxID=2697035 RepID=A0ABW9XYF8_9BACL|nr:hypothetical protein [Paenibacillus glycinis]NBD27299.1 hypothetical protein [Paenibacillus glycinis]